MQRNEKWNIFQWKKIQTLHNGKEEKLKFSILTHSSRLQVIWILFQLLMAKKNISQQQQSVKSFFSDKSVKYLSENRINL